MRNRKLIAAYVCAGVLSIAAGVTLTGCANNANAAVQTEAQTEAVTDAETPAETGTEAVSEAEETNEAIADADVPVRVQGVILDRDENTITIDNQSGVSAQGEMVLILGEDTLILDGVDGYPVPAEDIAEGDTVYAYINDAMMLSLPPQVGAQMILCGVPEDAAAPEYITVSSIAQAADGGWEMESTAGVSYQIPEDCQILPYLTRNIVTFEDVHEDSRCLVWSDDNGNVEKVVLFAD